MEYVSQFKNNIMKKFNEPNELLAEDNIEEVFKSVASVLNEEYIPDENTEEVYFPSVYYNGNNEVFVEKENLTDNEFLDLIGLCEEHKFHLYFKEEGDEEFKDYDSKWYREYYKAMVK